MSGSAIWAANGAALLDDGTLIVHDQHTMLTPGLLWGLASTAQTVADRLHGASNPSPSSEAAKVRRERGL